MLPPEVNAPHQWLVIGRDQKIALQNATALAETQKLTEALGYAIGTYKNDTEEFKKIAARGMAQDLSWELAAEKYEEKLIEAKYSW